ncbi:MAG: CpaF family protein, partial [Phycisphaerae bacterium]|nr:CpaF family protein [Phycisphaerae bacterium]
MAEVWQHGLEKGSTPVVKTQYAGALDQQYETSIKRLTRFLVVDLRLKLNPENARKNLDVVEKNFHGSFEKAAPKITEGLWEYVVQRYLVKDILDIVLSLGPLEDLLRLPNITEVMVVGKGKIYVEQDGVIHDTGRQFFSDEVVLTIIERIVTPIGRRIDRSQPIVDARLADGSRVNATIAPLSLSGPLLTIRKFAEEPFTIDDLIDLGTLSKWSANFLRSCVIGRKNILVTGGTASGKTTMLNVLSAFIPPQERIITIEDSAELQLSQEHVVSMETRQANVEGRGAYTIRDLVRNSLRMRPDRVIVGEVRGGEALDMLQAMNTGHDGSLTTLHANNPQDAMKRLESLVLQAVDMPVRAIREQVVTAMDLVVHITRFADGARKVTHISEVVGMDEQEGTVIIEDIFTTSQVIGDKRKHGDLVHTGYVPGFALELMGKGL